MSSHLVLEHRLVALQLLLVVLVQPQELPHPFGAHPDRLLQLLPLGADGEPAHQGLHVLGGGDVEALLHPPHFLLDGADAPRHGDEPVRDGRDVLGPQLHLLQGIRDVLADLQERVVEDVPAFGLSVWRFISM